MDPFTAMMLYSTIAGSSGGDGGSSFQGPLGKYVGIGGKKRRGQKLIMPSLDPMGAWAQRTVYGDITRALKGGGLLSPDIRARGLASQRASYKSAYAKARPELESSLNRLVPREDVGVRQFSREALRRNFYSGLQSMKEQAQFQPFEEQQEAMGMAASSLGQERRMGADITQMYNRYGTQMGQMPTFSSQLGYGLGSAGGWASAAQRWAQLMSNKQQGGF